MKKSRFFYVVLLGILVWVMIMYNDWQTELILKTAVILPVLSGVIAYLTFKRIQIRFLKDEEIQEKDRSFCKGISIKNEFFLPIAWLEVHLTIEDLLGNKQKQIVVMNVPANNLMNFLLPLSFHQYGIMHITIDEVKICDYFKLFQFRKKHKILSNILVLPNDDDCMNFKLSERKNEEYSADILETSEYKEGDNVRDIHWKLSSKSEELIVKHFDKDAEEEITVYVDTTVEKGRKSNYGHKVIEILTGIMRSCREQGIKCQVKSCNGTDVKERGFLDVLRELEQRTDKNIMFYHEFYNDTGNQRNVYITSGGSENIETSEFQYIKVDGKATEDRIVVDKKTLIDIYPEEETKENSTFVQIEAGEKQNSYIDVLKNNLLFRLLVTLIVFIGSFLAIESVFDIVVYERDYGFSVAVAVVCATYISFANGKHTTLKVKNIMILTGYIGLTIFGMISYGSDIIPQIQELLEGVIHTEGKEFGVFSELSKEIRWILCLLTFAIVDVLYYFTIRFNLLPHMIIITPLLSIPLIIGVIPRAEIVCIGILYYAILFGMNTSIGFRRKKKYLSGNCKNAGDVVLQIAGIIMAIVAMIFLLCNNSNNYEKSQWIKDTGERINNFLDEKGLNIGKKEGKEGEEDEGNGKINIVSAKRGIIDDTEKVEYTGDTVLEVTIDGETRFPVYLKSYAGTNYIGSAWHTRTTEQERMVNDEILTNVGEIYSDINQDTNLYQYYFVRGNSYLVELACAQSEKRCIITPYQVLKCTMIVDSNIYGDTNVYQPYYANNYNHFYVDGYSVVVDGVNRLPQEFTVMDAGSTTDSNEILEQYGEIPHYSEADDDVGAETDLKSWQRISQIHADAVKNVYLKIPNWLNLDIESFANVTITYGGKELNLVAGDMQYKQVGYEPYIQYVRQYFKNNGYRYDKDVVRTNLDVDMLEDFMDRKTGYCVHYASAAVFMFRTMGIPARYAEGYVVQQTDYAEETETGRRFDIPDSSSHAWVEIYQDGIGWIPVEVTPGMQNYIINSGDEKEPGTNQAINNGNEGGQQTTKAIEKKTTKKIQVDNKRKESQTESDIPDAVWVGIAIIIVLGAAAIRVHVCSGIHKKTVNENTNETISYLENVFVDVNRFFKINVSQSDLNEHKAEQYCKAVDTQNEINILDRKEMQEALRILDYFHYAKECHLSEEEMKIFKKVMIIYVNGLYRQGNICEKFWIRYIKCLYLDSKWVII